MKTHYPYCASADDERVGAGGTQLPAAELDEDPAGSGQAD